MLYFLSLPILPMLLSRAAATDPDDINRCTKNSGLYGTSTNLRCIEKSVTTIGNSEKSQLYDQNNALTLPKI